MKKYMPFFFCLVSFELFAQVELVPNGSFEILSQCPDAGNQIERAVGWFNCGETPDLCNACVTSVPYGVPTNTFGYQVASDGIGYADICTYLTISQYREIIGYTLQQPLVPGHNYHVSFKISRACNTLGYCMATDKIGVRFTNTQYSMSNPAPIDNFAHLYIDTVVTDTVNWTVFSEQWTADSAYEYIMVGNFFTDGQTNTEMLDSTSAAAFYYVDEVSVIDEGKNGVDELEIGNFNIAWQDGNIIVTTHTFQLAQVSIFNLLGQQILEERIIFQHSGQAIIEIGKQSTGMYLIMLRSGKKSFSIKFLKL